MKPLITVCIEVGLDETWFDREAAQELSEQEIFETLSEDWLALIDDAIAQDGIRIVRTAAEETTE